jgi:hypothetical protein
MTILLEFTFFFHLKLNTNDVLIDHAKDSYFIENFDKTELVLVKLNRKTLQVDFSNKFENVSQFHAQF